MRRRSVGTLVLVVAIVTVAVVGLDYEFAPIAMFLVTAGSTLLGVFIAFLITFEYDRQRKSTEQKELLNETKAAIGSELKANLSQITPNRQAIASQGSVPVNAIVLVFRSSAYQSAISVGSLPRLSRDVQEALSNIYLELRFIETLSQKMLEMLGTEVSNQSWSQYSDRVKDTIVERMGNLERDIPSVLKMLGISQPS